MNMNSSKTYVIALALAALFAGCVGSGPNTEQGAVGGAALGAVAGAIVGNNSGSHNALGGALIGGVAGGIAGGAIGNSLDHQRGTIYHSETEATTDVVVERAPPPPPRQREVVIQRPAPDMVWVAGYYAYAGQNREGRHYEWVPGHWERPEPQYRTFVEPHWARRGRGYVYVDGYWR